jgi:monothiol glutaredoxin
MLDDALRQRIDRLVRDAKVVVFIKGTRSQPRCGFSSRVVQQLDDLGVRFVDHDVLADGALREGMKAYADWPTFPQVWVDGSLIGGADILEELHRRGELAEVLGLHAPPASVQVTLTPSAAARIVAALGDVPPRLRLRIDPDFAHRFEAVEEMGAFDVTASSEGVTLVLDPTSAQRADGLRLDWVTSAEGGALVVDNPNEPPKVQPLPPHAYAAWRAQGRPHCLIDVRPPEERACAAIEGAIGAEVVDFDRLDPTLPTVFLCHHGVRSLHAAAYALDKGLRAVFNLEGGIDAWSLTVDPSVPRYGW